jgi:hypothetical protein
MPGMTHGLSLRSPLLLLPWSMDMAQRSSLLHHTHSITPKKNKLIGIARWQLVLQKQKQASFFFASLSTLFGCLLLLPPSLYELSSNVTSFM